MDYKLFTSEIEVEGKSHTTYGVESNDLIIKDVSTDVELVKELVQLLNVNEVAEEHFVDVVQDFLAQNHEIKQEI